MRLMSEWITPTNILASLEILGLVFAVFLYFRNPQVKNERSEALLSQRVQIDKEENDRRFTEMGTRLDEAMKLANNHIHTVDTKVDGVTKSVGELTVSVTRLSTIIDERIPKQHVI